MPRNMKVVGSRQHEKDAEVEIRTVKKRVRANTHSLPYLPPLVMVKFQVMGAVITKNMILRKGQSVSSIELFTGVKTSLARDVRAECGEYFQVYVSPSKVKKRGMAARTVAAIALASAGNGRGTWWFLSLVTGAVFRGDRWVSMPMSDIVIETMNKMSDVDHTKRKVVKKTREKKAACSLQPILEKEEQEETDSEDAE
jgi:hypothetical protein